MNILTKISAALFLLSTLFWSSCVQDNCSDGQGNIETTYLNIPSFNGLRINGSDDVVISYGPFQEVMVRGNQNVINRIKKNVYNSVWHVELEDGCMENYSLKYYITIPYLTEVTVTGSGDVEIGDFFTTSNNLRLETRGSGSIKFHRFSPSINLDVNISGSGSIRNQYYIGQLNVLDLNISGSGDFVASELNSKNALIQSTGSGDAYVRAEDQLVVNITGSGNVYYKGYPAVKNFNITGSGNVYDNN